MSSHNQCFCFKQSDSHLVKFLAMQFFSFPFLTPTYVKLQKKKHINPWAYLPAVVLEVLVWVMLEEEETAFVLVVL